MSQDIKREKKVAIQKLQKRLECSEIRGLKSEESLRAHLRKTIAILKGGDK